MKKNKDIKFVLIIAVASAIIIFSNNNHLNKEEKTETKISNLNNFQTSVSLSSEKITVEKESLCDKIYPYTSIFDLKNLCISNGGSWTCDIQSIGCYNLNYPIIDCTSELIKSASEQCSSIANYNCNQTTISCSY